MAAVNPTLAHDHVSGGLFPLPESGENLILKRDGIDFECKLARGGKLWGRGCFFLSSKRLVFVAAEKSCRADFKSFEIPLAMLREPKFEQPIFGANYLSGRATPPDDPASPLAGGPTLFSLTFNCGGCGTFLPLFYRLMSEVQQASAAPAPLEQAVQEGRIDQVAFVDPSDPSVLYLSQPTAAPNSQENTRFEPSAPPPDAASGARPAEQASNCTCS
mmetsp:Transcript_27886/g.59034  ORF Transcript_27886/g.59034 Transcript_27886/m.59034 type:complete len:217 (+) Transcript_27886:61-711(+)